jgi:uncharacterized protein GlcG (DUF336 family)
MLTLAQSIAIAEAARAEARRRALQPLGIAVLDSGGHLLVFQREDGAGFARFHIAFGKAWGALGMGFGTAELADRAAKSPVFVTSVAAATQGRMIPSPGGVLITDGHETVGAVGISGDTGNNDEACAIAGITAAGLSARSN